MTGAVQNDLSALLEIGGARPRGNRHDCPKCNGLRTVTHTEELFFCHRCQWRGNVVTLAKELGFVQRLSRAKYERLHRERERAKTAAQLLYGRVKSRRLELLDFLRTLDDLEAAARRLGPDNPEAWDGLSTVHAQRPTIFAELAILENSGAEDLLRFLFFQPQERERVIERVHMCGGMPDPQGRFVEVARG